MQIIYIIKMLTEPAESILICSIDSGHVLNKNRFILPNAPLHIKLIFFETYTK